MKNEILQILEMADTDHNNIRPTFLYNEGWLLKIILQQLKERKLIHPDLLFPDDNINWFSEPLLPTPFSARYRGDKLSERNTEADGVVGRFKIGKKTKTGLTLNDSCDFFYVTEAKMYSPLSSGTKNAPDYDQAARNIACIAKLIYDKKLPVENFKKLGFYVLLPEEQKDKVESFRTYTNINNIKEKISKRIQDYPDDDLKKRDIIQWFKNNFENYLEKLDVKLITWEELIEKSQDSSLNNFYIKCKKYNKKKSKN